MKISPTTRQIGISRFDSHCERFFFESFRELAVSFVGYNGVLLSLDPTDNTTNYIRIPDYLKGWSVFEKWIIYKHTFLYCYGVSIPEQTKLDVAFVMRRRLDLAEIRSLIETVRSILKGDARLVFVLPHLPTDAVSELLNAVSASLGEMTSCHLSAVNEIVLEGNVFGLRGFSEASLDFIAESAGPDLEAVSIEIQVFERSRASSPPPESMKLCLDAEFHGGDQFSNSNIFRALVQIGCRIGYARSRTKLALSLLETGQDLNLAAYLACSTVYLYAIQESKLELNSSVLVEIEHTVKHSLADLGTKSKAEYRWIVSTSIAIARLYEQLKLNDLALSWYRKALDLNPSRSSVLLEAKRVAALKGLLELQYDGNPFSPSDLSNAVDSVILNVFGQLQKRPLVEFARMPDFWFTELGDLLEGLGELKDYHTRNSVDSNHWSNHISSPKRKFGLYDLCAKLQTSNEDLHRANQSLDRANRELLTQLETESNLRARQRRFIRNMLVSSSGKPIIVSLISSVLSKMSLSENDRILVFGKGDVASYIDGLIKQAGFKYVDLFNSDDFEIQSMETSAVGVCCVIYTPFELLTDQIAQTLSMFCPRAEIIDLHSEWDINQHVGL